MHSPAINSKPAHIFPKQRCSHAPFPRADTPQPGPLNKRARKKYALACLTRAQLRPPQAIARSGFTALRTSSDGFHLRLTSFIIFIIFRPLECVSKRKIRKFEWILRQFKEETRRLSSAKSRVYDAEMAQKTPKLRIREFLRHTLGHVHYTTRCHSLQ